MYREDRTNNNCGNRQMSTKKYIWYFLYGLLAISFIHTVDLTNYSLSFPSNGNGYVSMGNSNVDKMTFEAWVKLGPNDSNALVASKYGSWEVKIVNDRVQLTVVQEWDYLWTTSYGYGTSTQYDDQYYVSSHALCNYGQDSGLFGNHNCQSSPDLYYYYDAAVCGYHNCVNDCNYYGSYSNQHWNTSVNSQNPYEGTCSEWHYDLSNGRSAYWSGSWYGANGYCESACYHNYSQCADYGNRNTCSQIHSSRQSGAYTLTSTNTYDFSHEWHHISVTFDGLTMKVYVNGIAEGSRTDYHANGYMTPGYNNVNTYSYAHQNGSGYIATRVYNNSNYINLGKNTQVSGSFVGLLDEVRFWGIARSSSEITWNKHFTAITPDEMSLLYYYKFNNTGNLGISSSNLNLTASLYGGVTWVSLPRPSAFNVYAQDGENMNSIQVTWVDDTNENQNFKIYRNGNSYATVGGTTESWSNNYPAADVGIYYNYCITAVNGNTETDAFCDVGFIDQTGTISGHIETEGGSDVEEAKLAIIPNDGSPIGSSVAFDGVNDYVDLTPFIPLSNWDKNGYTQQQSGSGSNTFDLGTSNFTIEAWIKASSTSNRMPVVSLESTTTNRGLYLYTNSGHQIQSDLTNSAGPHSYLNGVWDAGESYTDLATLPYLNNLGSWAPPEQYTDSNGNGVWDGSESFTDWDLNGYRTTDVESYSDINVNQLWDPPESWTDINGDGTWNDADPLNDTNGNHIWDDGEPFTDINNNHTRDDNESFTDVNGNSQWDPPESYSDTNQNGQWDAAEPYTDFNVNGEWDAAEPFVDYNGNGQYDVNINEPFVDTDGNGQWFSGEQLVDMNNNNVWDAAEPWVDINDEVTNNSWHHVAVVNNGGWSQMYVDGLPSGSAVYMSHNIDANDVLIGGDNVGRRFSGYIDEVRIWNNARTATQMKRYFDLSLKGDEAGLIGYWKFDENVFNQTFDVTTNNNHGTLKSATWYSQNSSVTMGDYTNFYGNYTVNKISYGSGTQYKVTPSKTLHEFDPVFRLRTLNGSNPIADQVDFTDISSYPVAGVVKYVGTDCYAADVFIYSDGFPVSGGTTNVYGEFSFDVPIGQHYLSPVHGLGDFRPAHYPYCYDPDPDFSDCSSPHNFTGPVTNILFYDHKKHKLTIDVSGGACNRSMGQVQVRIQSTDPSSCMDETYETDATGHLEVLLPPISYIVNVDPIDYPLITPQTHPQFGPRTADMRSGDLDLVYKYYAPPNIEFSGIPSGCAGSDGNEIPIYYQYESDTLSIRTYEKYGYYNGTAYTHWASAPLNSQSNAECAVDEVTAYITDNIADIPGGTQTIQIYNGSGFWVVNVGQPNILSGGAHPFQEKIQVVIEDNYGTDTETIWAFIEGKYARNQAFATTGPDIPTLVLRDPPGDASFAYMNETSSSCFAMSVTLGSSFGVNAGASVHAGAEFEVGTPLPLPYFGVDTEIHADISTSMGVTFEGKNGQELNVCTETSETFSTSDDDQVIGHDGDVYVGGAINILYGITDNIWLFSSDTLNNSDGSWNSGDHMQPAPNNNILHYAVNYVGDCVIKKDSGLFIAPEGFATTYIYTENYIVNYMVPQLQFLAANAENVEPGEPYIDGNNNSQYDIGEEYVDLNQNNQYDADFTQSVNDFNADVTRWMEHVNRNNWQKNNATFKENISFSAGANYEYSFSGSRSSTSTQEFSMGIENSLAIEVGADINGIGVGATMEMTFGLSFGSGQTFTNENTTTTGFTLSDNDIGDGFTIDIMVDPVYSTPIFKLVSAVTSCPYESSHIVDITNPDGSVSSDVVLSIATVPRDVPVFNIESNNILLNVPPDDPAVYTITLGNASETPPSGEVREYAFFVDQNTNPNGATIKIGGVPLQGEMSYIINPFTNINATVTVERGPVEYEYDNITMIFKSVCDTSRYVTQAISAHFIPPCSPISIVDVGDNWVININNEDSLNVTLSDYDLSDQYLRELRIEYKQHGTNTWIPTNAVPVDSISSDFDYVQVTWDVSGIGDETYDLRAVAQCEANQSITASVIGVIDRVRPGVIGSPSPQDGVLEPNDEIFVDFTENINCSHINPPDHIFFEDLENALTIPRDFVCMDNSIFIMPTMPDQWMENRTVSAQLLAIEDMYGNAIADPVSWDVYVNRNPVRWDVARVNPVKYPDTHLTFQATLTNTGPDYEPWELTNFPGWMTADVMSGALEALESVTVTFDVSDNVNTGITDIKVYAETLGGNEDLRIHLRVLCTNPPDWEVIASNYQYNMSITGVLYVESELSSDNFDMVSAWVDDELRGVAPVITYEDVNINGNIVDLSEVFLTVYSNQSSGEEISFRVWDSSICTEYAFVEENYDFAANTPLGLPTEPVTFSASGAIVYRYDIDPGWSWISMNVSSEDMSVNNVLQNLSADTNDLIKNQIQFSQYVEGMGWIGALSTINFESMYQTRVQNAQVFEIVGEAVDTDTNFVSITNGWNWLGYLPQFITNTNNALSALNSVTGDIVKSQYGFAQYVEGAGWLGSLPFMNPKLGYMLRATNADSLFFPAQDDGNIPTFSRLYYSPELVDDLPDLGPIAKENPYTMHFVISLNKGEYQKIMDTDLIIAKVGDEVRGYEATVWIPYLNEFEIFLTVYGKYESGEGITFQHYDAINKEYNDVYYSASFTVNQIVGTTDEPLKLDIAGYVPLIPDDFALYPNFPNPFNPTTEIRYNIPDDVHVQLIVYNLEGRKIKTLVDEFSTSGYKKVIWDSTNEDGMQVASGVYFYKMTAGSFSDMKKMVILK